MDTNSGRLVKFMMQLHRALNQDRSPVNEQPCIPPGSFYSLKYTVCRVIGYQKRYLCVTYFLPSKVTETKLELRQRYAGEMKSTKRKSTLQHSQMLMYNCAQCFCFSVASDLAASLQKSLKFSKCILVVATNSIIDSLI